MTDYAVMFVINASNLFSSPIGVSETFPRGTLPRKRDKSAFFKFYREVSFATIGSTLKKGCQQMSCFASSCVLIRSSTVHSDL